MLGETFKCEACKKKYELTSIELSFYLMKGLPLPKLCRPCKARVSTEQQEDYAKPMVANAKR